MKNQELAFIWKFFHTFFYFSNIINQRMNRIILEMPNKFEEDYITKFPERICSFISGTRFRSYAFRQRYLSSKISSKNNLKEHSLELYDVDSIPLLRQPQGELKKSKSISETTSQNYKLNFLLPRQVKKLIEDQKAKDEQIVSKVKGKLEIPKHFFLISEKKIKVRRSLRNQRVETQPSIESQSFALNDNINSLTESAILSDSRSKDQEKLKQIFVSPSQISKKSYGIGKKFRMIKQRKGKQLEMVKQKLVAPFFGKLSHKQ